MVDTLYLPLDQAPPWRLERQTFCSASRQIYSGGRFYVAYVIYLVYIVPQTRLNPPAFWGFSLVSILYSLWVLWRLQTNCNQLCCCRVWPGSNRIHKSLEGGAKCISCHVGMDRESLVIDSVSQRIGNWQESESSDEYL